MLKRKFTLFIIIVIGFFLFVNYLWYTQALKHLKQENIQEQSIIFLKLKAETIRLLDQLSYSNEKIKAQLLKKHKIVKKMLNSYSQDISKIPLNDIYESINIDNPLKPFDIYVTNKDFIVTNSTNKNDIGFDLSFAKSILLKNYKLGKTDITQPIYNSYSKTFYSYASSFLNLKNTKGNILQVSYNFTNMQSYLNNITDIFSQYPAIVEHRCYTQDKDSSPTEIIFKDHIAHKINIIEIIQGEKEAQAIEKKLINTSIHIDKVLRNDKEYLAFYATQKSSLLGDNNKAFYYVLLNQSNYSQRLHKLNLLMLLVLFLGISTILFFTYYINHLVIKPILNLQYSILKNKSCSEKQIRLDSHNEITMLINYYNKHFQDIQENIRLKDTLLKEKNIFVNNAIHEINTPLSVISTNNSLRDLVQGKSEYSNHIISAIKTLKNTMDDLSFSMYKPNMLENRQKIDLVNFLQNRIEYFKSIADSSSISFNIIKLERCTVFMNELELSRLIDNNLSNAIKYSYSESKINISLSKENQTIILTFQTHSDEIINSSSIFKRYYRENSVKGGFGLGLNIVKQITDKYKIKIDVYSKNGLNHFTYVFKCHKEVI